MHDYDRVERVIHKLERHSEAQPDLETMASWAGLSPHHFHRLFSRWAGVTPKDFVQCLTMPRAKALLSEGRAVLETAVAAGLSGPGRLHDLCVAFESASPGEIKSAGAGLTLTVGYGDSPFGPCLLAESPRGICHLSFDLGRTVGMGPIQAAWPNARLKRDDGFAERRLAQIFRPGGPRHEGGGLRAFVSGTAFQVRVWRALLRIPFGNLASYGDIAKAVGSPGASRAVGTAVGSNPIAYLIPCHRVIRESGVLGEYGGGKERKRAILAWEAFSM
jgi:AraC family transcriptional regulator of adaptative response/methylated-DNA-[protein]-cysteine methyltransferase